MQKNGLRQEDFRRFSSRAHHQPTAYEDSEEEPHTSSHDNSSATDSFDEPSDFSTNSSNDDDDEEEEEVYTDRVRKSAQTNRKRPVSGIVSDEEEESFDDDDYDYDDGSGGYRKASAAVFDGTIPIDPNGPEQVESIWGWDEVKRQALIKWKGKSHRADTWESAERIHKELGAGRKLQNFIAKRQDNDELEQMVIGFKELERVISTTIHGQTRYYLCKWEGICYSGCTWEPEGRLQEDQDKIDAFLVRSSTQTKKTSRVGTTFQKMDEMPDYLRIGGQLRDYQQEGVNWLVYSWCQGINAILADEMGLGKTIQSVSFISVLNHDYGMTGPSLVVVPLSTIDAWKREFARWAPSLNVLTYVGDARSRTVLRKYEIDSASWPVSVLLTTYELIMKDRAILSLNWKLLLIDEGHRLKSGQGLLHESLVGVAPAARFLVTGTPLQNSLQELWSLLHFLMPKRFPDFDIFCSKYAPDGADQSDEAVGERLAKLHAILKPHLLRRMKKDVEKSLPAKTERILRIPLSATQKDLYGLILSKNYRELAARQTGSSRNTSSLSNILVELKKVCNHPRLVTGTGDVAADKLANEAGKLILLDQLLPRLKSDGHRVLIFSQMVRMLDLLSIYLNRRGHSFLRIDGGTSNDSRRRAIDEFNRPKSEIFTFLLSTRAGGLGINLETADTVIIYDSDWNPQNDLQAMARAHRIGQTRPVSIFRLVSRGTVEETILERAKQKMVLDHLVIQNTSWDRQELQAILQFGAQAIFSDSSTGSTADEQVQFDLDAILSRETITTANPTEETSSELLGAFQVADFSSNNNNNNKKDLKSWDEIIPSSAIAAVKEEAAEKERMEKELEVQAALYTSATRRQVKRSVDRLPPSQPQSTASASSSAGASASASASEVNKKVHEELPCAKSETKLMMVSLMKWGPRRIEKISQETSLPVESIRQTIEIVDKVLGREQCKGVTFSNGYYLSLAQTRDRFVCLRGLYQVISDHENALDSFRIVEAGKRIKSVALVGAHRWNIPSWSILDDARLLVGVWKYGFGEWDAILHDPKLQLEALLEPLNNPDAKILPKSLHLGRRVEYLISGLCKSEVDEAAADRDSGKKVKAKVKQPRVPPREPKPQQDDDLRHFFKAVRPQLAFLTSLDADSVASRLQEVCEAVRILGDHISQGRRESDGWPFVCKAWPSSITPDELRALYAKLQQNKQ